MSSKSESQFVAADFFNWRTPLLPVSEIERWSEGLEAPLMLEGEGLEEKEEIDREQLSSVLERDRARLREGIANWVDQPEIREALFVASPSLLDGLERWRTDPDSRKGKRAEAALVRYLQRMATRCTPFGLFSGCSLGTISGDPESATRLELVGRDRYQRHTRLDADYLVKLTRQLATDPVLRNQLSYRPNSTLYRSAGRLRYAEERPAGQGISHHLVALDLDEYLELVISAARQGAGSEELATALLAADPDGEILLDEAREYIGELIDSQVLVDDLTPAVTGPEPIKPLIELLARKKGQRAVAERLERLRGMLARMDSAGLAIDPAQYKRAASELESLPAQVNVSRLFQVDMSKPSADATLDPRVTQEVMRAVQILHRLAGPSDNDGLGQFRSDFSARYQEQQLVPLNEALDEEIGIGYQAGAGVDASPLLEGFSFPRAAKTNTQPWTGKEVLLLRKLERAFREDANQIEITNEEVERFSEADLPPLPNAFSVLATLMASSAEAVDRGDFRLLFHTAAGPSGARLLGRFCHGDSDMHSKVEAHLHAEEALDREAIHAEVVHLPEGRMGNVVSRPVLRGYEIPFMGRSGAPVDRQLPVSDLLVTVIADHVVLLSKRLGRRVVPRLTTAHNFTAQGLSVYRFLGALQSQGVRPGLRWDWGPLAATSFLPRVVSGRVVLSRATWNLPREEIVTLTAGTAEEQILAVRQWRLRRRIPRRVLFVEADNELLVDFENILSLEALLSVVARSFGARLVEFLPGPDELCARGPEGAFTHELVIPFIRTSAPRRSIQLSTTPVTNRTFVQGSQWLCASIYTGVSLADRLLVDRIAPLAQQVVASGAAESWFFIRYSDPEWHLRVRFTGAPERLRAEVQPLLERVAQQAVEEGTAWKFQFDTYQREIERYGGEHGIELSEALFHADSEAVVKILAQLEGDEGANARWILTLRGIDRLLSDLGFEGDDKLLLVERMQQGYAAEYRVGAGFKQQLSRRLRKERAAIEDVLTAETAGHPWSQCFALLDERSRRVRPIAGQLRDRQARGLLSLPLSQIATSFVHMFVNRIVRSDGRSHELILMDFLFRSLSSLERRRAAVARKLAG